MTFDYNMKPIRAKNMDNSYNRMKQRGRWGHRIYDPWSHQTVGVCHCILKSSSISTSFFLSLGIVLGIPQLPLLNKYPFGSFNSPPSPTFVLLQNEKKSPRFSSIFQAFRLIWVMFTLELAKVHWRWLKLVRFSSPHPVHMKQAFWADPWRC